MDLIDSPPKFELYEKHWNIYSRNLALSPHYIGTTAKVTRSTVTEGCSINGTVDHSVIFSAVSVGENSIIKDSVIFPGAVIGKNVKIKKAVIGQNAIISDGAQIGTVEVSDNSYASAMCTNGIVLIEGGVTVGADEIIPKGSMVESGEQN